MTIVKTNDFQPKWAMVVSVADLDDYKRKELNDFAFWFMDKIKSEGSRSGCYYNFENSPVITVESEVGVIESCSEAYQKIQKNYPQVLLVVHILPHLQSSEYEWMKLLAQRYGFIRQGILYENAVKRFESIDLNVQNVFKNMCQWIYRSGSAMTRYDAKSCGLLIGSGSKPTIEKILYNSEDIKEAVNFVLHKDDVPTGQEAESSLKLSGYPRMLNTFGIAQLVVPFRVIGVSQIGSDESIVTLENKFQAFQAVRALDGKQIDRNHTLTAMALGTQIAAKLNENS